MKHNLSCKNCGKKVTKDKSNSQWNYPYECVECDESFFEFELITEKN
jgi:predicted RNA-binding Zn-ribbon protein involved in translation (DUF1610 family)